MYIGTVLFFNKKKNMNGEMHRIAAKLTPLPGKTRRRLIFIFIVNFYCIWMFTEMTRHVGHRQLRCEARS